VIVLAILIQAATIPVSAPQSERWSILVPTPSEPCVPERKPGDKDDIIICANTQPSPRLPDPDSVPSSGPTPSNPYLTGSGALAAAETPCAISHNCVVGFGPPIVPLVKGAVGLAKHAFAKKPDKTGRVAIPLDDPAPTGKLLP
jgi:hypothetical protein